MIETEKHVSVRRTIALFSSSVWRCFWWRSYKIRKCICSCL